MRRFVLRSLIVCVTALMAVQVRAQAPAPAPAPAPAGPPPAGGTADGTAFDIPYGLPIGLETARKLIAAVEGGKLIGAIGCSGGTGDQDAAACKVGADLVK